MTFSYGLTVFDPDYGIFSAIVAAGSISAAARSHGLSTAAMSKRLARLEQRIGVRLINRTTRHLYLTPAGKELLETLLPIEAALKQAEERIAGKLGSVAGPLRISAPTAFGRLHVIPAIPSFLAEFPDVELEIELSDGFVDLLDGKVDLAIRIGARIASGLIARRLGGSSRVLCAAPAYLAVHGQPINLNDLKHHQLLAADGQLPWNLDGPDGPIKFAGKSLIKTNSSEAIRQLACQGCGIALRSLWEVAEDLDSGALVQVLPAYRGSGDVAINAVRAAGLPASATIDAFLSHLAASLPTSVVTPNISPALL